MQTNVFAKPLNFNLYNSQSKKGFRKVVKSQQATEQVEPFTPIFAKSVNLKDVEENTDCSSMKGTPKRGQSPNSKYDQQSKLNLKSTSESSLTLRRNLNLNNCNTLSRNPAIFCSDSKQKLQETSPTKIKLTRNRKKEKSLQILTFRFLKQYAGKKEGQITLQEIQNSLGTLFLNPQFIILDVEKRRIYDVVNILESFKVIFRVEKNCYLWCGIESIEKTISKYERGIKVQTPSDIHQLCKNKGNKKKMLTSLSAKFIKYFLKQSQPVTLEEAAKEFCEENIVKGKIKTKIRRLYDISNVFSALGLIKKTFIDCRKPAFVWLGLEGYLKVKSELTDCLRLTQINEIKNNPMQVKQKVNIEKTLQSMFKNVMLDSLKNRIRNNQNQIPIFFYQGLNTQQQPQLINARRQLFKNEIQPFNMQYEQIQKIKKNKKLLKKRKRGKMSFDDISSVSQQDQLSKIQDKVHKYLKTQMQQSLKQFKSC